MCMSRLLCYLHFVLALACCTCKHLNIQKELTPKENHQISSRYYVLEQFRWPNATVYYDMDPSIMENRELLKAIRSSMAYLTSETKCLRFVQRYPWDDSIENYVSFIFYEDTEEDLYCASSVGFFGDGKQLINFGRFCIEFFYSFLNTTTERRHPVLHEIMHTLGLSHTHSRPDRDCYIWVSEFARNNFPEWMKMSYHSLYFTTNFPFDFESVTNYMQEYDFVHPYNSSLTLGREDGFVSNLDIWKINHLYCGAVSYCEQNLSACEAIKMANLNNPNCTQFEDQDQPQALALAKAHVVREDWFYNKTFPKTTEEDVTER